LVAKSQPYPQSARNSQPRVGFAWDVFKNGKTMVRSAYAIMTDQPITGIVTALATNPPYAVPVSFATTGTNLSFANAFPLAGGAVSPRTIDSNYKDSYMQSYNFNIQQQLSNDLGLMVGYFGSKGTHLNIVRNIDQPINGVKPFQNLSASSPILPGSALGSTILLQDSGGNSNYNALWVTATKQFSKGLQFNASYTFSKSIDYNSRNNQGLTVQDSYNIRNDRGLSDFDARQAKVGGAFQHRGGRAAGQRGVLLVLEHIAVVLGDHEHRHAEPFQAGQQGTGELLAFAARQNALVVGGPFVLPALVAQEGV